MVPRSSLRTVVADQLSELSSLTDTVERTLYGQAASYSGASALVVKGMRRCGKSTLLKQVMTRRFPGDFHYFNFDDERVADFTAEDFQPLMETLAESFGPKRNLFFDEIQNVEGWELFVNRLLREGYRVYITGSSANLLSRELGDRLTGRHVDFELYPFSFTEYIRARAPELKILPPYTTQQRARLSALFSEYLERGGMPEVAVLGNDAVLTSILGDIVQKDITERYGVRKPSELRSALRFLISNVANFITDRSVTENFELSPNTLGKYIGYAEETYLVFTVPRYVRKVRRLEKNPRKVYCVDNGIVTRNSPSVADRRPALLENAVAVHLRRIGKEFYYFKGSSGAEADFLLPGEQAIQVCYELNQGNESREAKGLLAAISEADVKRGVILTLDQETEITRAGATFPVVPAWRWLLENETGERS